MSQPIRNPQENHVTRMVADRTSDAIQKSRLSMTRHSNDLRSHERDGRKRRKKSLYAQKPHVYVRNKSLTRKIRTSTYALSRLRAKTYVVRTKSPRAHKSYTYAISRSRPQVVLYVRNKSLYAQKLYILRKVAYRAYKPYNLRTLSLQHPTT